MIALIAAAAGATGFALLPHHNAGTGHVLASGLPEGAMVTLDEAKQTCAQAAACRGFNFVRAGGYTRADGTAFPQHHQGGRSKVWYFSSLAPYPTTAPESGVDLYVKDRCPEGQSLSGDYCLARWGRDALPDGTQVAIRTTMVMTRVGTSALKVPYARFYGDFDGRLNAFDEVLKPRDVSTVHSFAVPGGLKNAWFILQNADGRFLTTEKDSDGGFVFTADQPTASLWVKQSYWGEDETYPTWLGLVGGGFDWSYRQHFYDNVTPSVHWQHCQSPYTPSGSPQTDGITQWVNAGEQKACYPSGRHDFYVVTEAP